MSSFLPSRAALAVLIATALFEHRANAQQPPGLPWDEMDLGPFHSATFKIPQLGDQVTAKGIAIKVGTRDEPATMLFDTELLRVTAFWTGGFIEFPRGRGGLEGPTKPAGKVIFGTTYAAGWAGKSATADSRPNHQGPISPAVAKWRGLYLNGGHVTLSYTVGPGTILETPGTDKRGGKQVFTRTFTTNALTQETSILLADVPGAKGSVGADGVAMVEVNDSALLVAVLGAPKAAVFEVAENGRVTLKLPSVGPKTTFQVAMWGGAKSEMPKNADLLKPSTPVPDPTALIKAGPARWGSAIETKGITPEQREAAARAAWESESDPNKKKQLKERLDAIRNEMAFGYWLDDITLPDPNPFKSWLRPGGHDFFANGDAALVNCSGDVWLVSGLDDKLEHVKWKRFATGLFQPLGCKIVDGKIYVLGRDQITRLHDLNNDGEADFYECFNNDCVVTDNYHEFALDLETDSAGNFYYTKGSPWTPTNTSPHQGTLLRVSKNGVRLDVVATGLRAPNGLGIGPKDFLTCSDNQGHWIPANRLNIINPGGFYGMVPAAHKKLHFKARDGTEFDANPSSAEDRQKFKTEFWGNSPIPTSGQDLPLVWLPQKVDNSPGDEVWVTGGKWGPWEGHMLHLSYGHCALYGVAMETVEGVAQGAVIRFPFKFPSGIMRSRFSPKDGQLYVSGLNVWQSDATKFGCFSRIRYAGKPVTMAQEVKVLKDGLQIGFTGPLDPTSATDAQNYSIERWNYQWTGEYGSPDLKPSTGKIGQDLVLIDSISLSPNKRTVTLHLPEMTPVMQMHVRCKIKSADGRDVEQDIHNTVHRVPELKIGSR